MHKEKLLKLINEYIACSNYACGLLKDLKGDTETIIRAIRLNKIPKEGVLEHNIYYNFHGIGCFFQLPNNRIEIDFGPNDRCDGFDINKLEIFLYSKENDYPEFMNKKNLEEAFLKLLSEHIIYNPQWPPSEHLYYLNNGSVIK